MSDIAWAKDEEKRQRKLTDDLNCCYLDKLDVFNELQAQKNELECISRYQRKLRKYNNDYVN